MSGKSPFKLLSREAIFKNKYLEAYKDIVQMSDGVEREYVWSSSAGDGLAVVAIDNNSVWLIRQYKYATDEFIWSVPAGGVENGEEPLKWARIELRQEAGLVATNWTNLGYFYSSPSTYKQKAHMFLAQGLKNVDHEREVDEVIETRKVSIKTAWKMILDNEIMDSFAIVALLKAFSHLGWVKL